MKNLSKNFIDNIAISITEFRRTVFVSSVYSYYYHTIGFVKY